MKKYSAGEVDSHRFALQIISVLTRVMGSRDSYTADHQGAVSGISRAIAQELDIDMFDVEGIRFAGTLHDIGKVVIPLELLTKTGRLNKEEFSLIQTHSLRGVELLHGIEFPWPISDMVAQHHERLDGSGYPYGLSAESISIGARILAVADTFDAVVNSRPYRKALGMDKALEILSQTHKHQYDQNAVAALQQLIDANSGRVIRYIE
ncbi:HD-GYP domain-containing protein [Oceanicoccus sp. KOV_DT_Chl]|uniref:HD-GYP domain-containing protein n=1 Tax=Oceanicoccus sp. KOV_DT_Chl TaxID=1904639 RepID=UPI000C7E6E3A|nr:HD domain-containing phosphohydrolase [Oceanicoccus sp. KOV_DT_Chl]